MPNIRPNSVIVLGDRQVGKTNTIIALKTTQPCNIEIVNDLSSHYNPETGVIPGTFARKDDTLEMIVKLPAGKKHLYVNWVDTPGERWEDISKWQKDFSEEWSVTQEIVSQSQAIFLVLPPYRQLIRDRFFQKYSEAEDKIENFPLIEQWKNNLSKWFTFFKENCRNASHILITIHKADFFCELNTESKKYCVCDRNLPALFQLQDAIRRQYFYPIDNIISEYNLYCNQNGGPQVQFFITTKYNNCMLQLPWLYLGAHFRDSDI